MNSEDREFLKSLQHEMLTQDTVCQDSPRFWMIGDYKMVNCMEGCEERYMVYSPGTAEDCDMQELLDDIKENNLEDMSEEAKEAFAEIGCEVTAIEWLQQYHEKDAYLIPVREQFFLSDNTMFLTLVEAKQHLTLNHYHYSKKAHPYAMTAWRSPQVKRLFEILEKTDWDQV